MKSARNSVLIVVLIVIAWLGRLMFAASEAKAVLVGDDLELRCNQTNNSTWWFDGKRLHGNTHLVSKTLILKIRNVTINNQGTYWCGLSWKLGYNVSVIVGNLPSAPRSVYHDSLEWQDRVHWVASLYTGGLPVYYMVTAQCLLHPNASDSDINCSYYKDQQQTITSHIHHVKDKKYMFKLGSKELDLYQLYQVCIFAINELGNSSNCINLKRSTERTVPAPPPDFKAKEIRQGEVLLSWTQRKAWDLYLPKEVVIVLSYSKIGDSQNMTVEEYAIVGSATISHLKANSDYIFYAEIQYRFIGGKPTVLSSSAIATLHTQDSDPDKSPQNLKCNGSASYSQGKRNISLSWEPPPKSSQNGVLTKYIVHVKTGQKSFNQTVNASQTSVVLSGLSDSDDLRVDMQVCNEGGFCSGIGETCTVSGILKSKSIPSPTPSIIVGSIIATLVVLLISACVVFYFYNKRLKKSTNGESSPIGPEISGPLYDDTYAQAEFNQNPEVYTRPYHDDCDIETPLVPI